MHYQVMELVQPWPLFNQGRLDSAAETKPTRAIILNNQGPFIMLHVHWELLGGPALCLSTPGSG